MSKERNKYVNDLHKDNTTNKYLEVREGNCDYVKCQSACCRFNCQGHVKNSGHNKNYASMSDYQNVVGLQIKSLNRQDFYLTPRLCPYIKVEGGCELHDKRTQPRVCKYFPMYPSDGVFQAVKHVCGYKFVKVRNPNYKSEKQRLEVKNE